jgi:OOP family OmpA-OmpF porin
LNVCTVRPVEGSLHGNRPTTGGYDALAVQGATASSLSKDESGTGFKIFAGNRFHRNFALEAGDADFGKFSGDAHRHRAVDRLGQHDHRVERFPRRRARHLPVGNFDLFGKPGLIYTTTKADNSFSGITPLNTGGKKSELNSKSGLGAEWHLSNKVGLRAEWERAFSVGDAEKTGEGDIDLVSIGVTYRF